MKSGLRCLLGCALLALACVACDRPSSDARVDAEQKYFFLESLKQVEAGGRQLQGAGLDHDAVSQALAALDQGLKLGFEVKRPFLDKLDLRLGKNFERYFIEGVENYRLGIEAGDEEQQRRGLVLLQKWAEFWSAERAAILARLETE